MLKLFKNGVGYDGAEIPIGSFVKIPEAKITLSAAFAGWTQEDENGDIWLLEVDEIDFLPPTAAETRAAMPTLSPVQFRKMLRGQGITAAMVKAAIAAIPDAEARADASDAWEYATFFERLNPLIDGIGTALDLPPEDIDTIWQDYAATL